MRCYIPIALALLTSAHASAQSVSAGNGFSLGVHQDGTAYAWGQNDAGQLCATTSDTSTPVSACGSQTIRNAGGLKLVRSGYDFSLGLTADGRLTAWGGANDFGQLGYCTTRPDFVLTDVADIAAGQFHALAVKRDGTVWAWGYNTSGQLGLGNRTSRCQPTQITAISGAAKVAAGGNHSLVLTTSGDVYAFGDNQQGQLGLGHTNGDGASSGWSNPQRIATLSSIALIAAGQSHSLAARTSLTSSTLYAWGQNRAGQLGDASTITRTAPVTIPSVWSNVNQPGQSHCNGVTSYCTISSLAASTENTLITTSDGALWTWGANTYGQLGTGNTTSASTPVRSGSFCFSCTYKAANASTSGYHTVVVAQGGSVWAAGRNSNGEIGTGTLSTQLTHARILGVAGQGFLNLGGSATAGNDNFANRTPIASGQTATANNADATKEAGEPSHAGNAGGKSLWWTYTAPAAGQVIVTTDGSNFDTLLAVYQGNAVSALTPIASNDDATDVTVLSRVAFQASAGAVYQIAVDGYNDSGDIGSGNISLTLTGPGGSTQTSVTLNPTSYSAPAGGGSSSFSVTTTPAGAAWTATASASWIAITSGQSGSGNGTVAFTIASNTGSARTGSITVANATFNITQAAGSSSTGVKLERAFMLRTRPACNWDTINTLSSVANYLPTDDQAMAWFLVSNAKIGDTYQIQYLTPAGQAYANAGTSGTLSVDQTVCIADANPLKIAGTAAASLTGAWTVRFTYLGQLLTTLTFTIGSGGGGGGGSTGANLIRNPGADEGAAKCSAQPTIPGWTADGKAAVCPHGIDLPADAPGPADRGANFFAGGDGNSASRITQIIDLASASAAIDAGTQPYTLSGWLGGYASQDDNATVKATFRNASGAATGTATIGPVLAAERSKISGLLQKTTSGSIPAGTRSVEIAIDFVRTSGSYNDGYVDNLSFTLGGGASGGSTLTVDSKSNIFAAGRATAFNGLLPVLWTLPANSTGKAVTFSGIAGKWKCFSGGETGPDGGYCAGSRTDVASYQGIAGIIHNSKTMFLVGVFIGATEPKDPAPGRRDVTTESTAAVISPQLNQVFFIGDGLTGEGTGTKQQFIIPTGATRLYLGIADAASFLGTPCCWDDNSGSVSVTVDGVSNPTGGGGGGITPGCNYFVNPLTKEIPGTGGSAVVLVTTGANCAWSANSNSNWITVRAGGGPNTGSGAVDYIVTANPSTTASRTGTVSIAGQTHTVTQTPAPACSYTLNPTSADVAGGGGTTSFTVQTATGCAWTAVPAQTWITVSQGASGNGPGTVSLTVAVNTSNDARTGTVTAGGATFTVRQAAGGANLPAIATGGVVNAASYAPGAQGLARGSFLSIFGDNIGPDPFVQATSFPLPTTLGETSIRVAQGGQSVNCIIVFTSKTQINAILPSNAPLGPAQLTVTFRGRTSAPENIQIVDPSFGIFLRQESGRNVAIVQNVASQTDYPLNTATNPAQLGQIVILWGTGLGAIAGADNVPPGAQQLSVTVEVRVGGKTAVPLYAGRAPEFAGVDNIYFTVPNDAAMGCAVPVQIVANGRLSNATTMVIGSCP